MVSSVSRGRDVPSAAQLDEILKVGERLRIRERIGVLHGLSVNRAADRDLAHLAAERSRDGWHGEYDLRYVAW